MKYEKTERMKNGKSSMETDVKRAVIAMCRQQYELIRPTTQHHMLVSPAYSLEKLKHASGKACSFLSQIYKHSRAAGSTA
jgi:hypothetical protein